MSIESVMPSSHLILCRPLLHLPPIPPSIRVFSNESTLHMRWPKYCKGQKGIIWISCIMVDFDACFFSVYYYLCPLPIFLMGCLLFYWFVSISSMEKLVYGQVCYKFFLSFFHFVCKYTWTQKYNLTLKRWSGEWWEWINRGSKANY